ncbi:nucleotidyltransferase substrate binding protein, HI0074 family [Geoalkalibacter ferrihydriticus]|uniref:Nucleotidyltransferase n=2 Tax=Geoalkalibacter ferrihydriticus TaxID=392333 RepID=A0A0C2HLB3_9BACT|nr:HI0074 family nucleotidyltransferase substrate-binding subunit [Geoalkalibacter ferrihydriticus]KIH77866.1 nucleotidyltransferase [Geoalkalibacter ferrihydriticus DSM 17813]SDL83205.1 nucleotidyltransferase substrate binding protein, HI0074 family [Geoalkalibacter ferrihydriticus]
MNDQKAIQGLANLEKALKRLDEALREPDTNSLVVDGTIQRFEFVIELYWKTLKRLLAVDGITANTPREALQKAFAAHWINDETAWLQMLRDRNGTSHLYDEAAARRIYAHIRQYFPELQKTFRFLADRFSYRDGEA